MRVGQGPTEPARIVCGIHRRGEALSRARQRQGSSGPQGYQDALLRLRDEFDIKLPTWVLALLVERSNPLPPISHHIFFLAVLFLPSGFFFQVKTKFKLKYTTKICWKTMNISINHLCTIKNSPRPYCIHLAYSLHDAFLMICISHVSTLD
jgi:hypothetical protein